MRGVLWAAGVGVGALLAAGCDGVPGRGAGGGGGSPVAAEMNHAELLAALNKKGLKLESSPANRGAAEGPAVYFHPSKPSHPKTTWGPAFFDDLYTSGTSDLVYVRLMKSPQEAKDAAGVNGDRSFAWGRFAFAVGDPDGKPLLAKVKAALP